MSNFNNVEVRSDENAKYVFVNKLEIGTVFKGLDGWCSQLFGFFILPSQITEQQAIQVLLAAYKEECPNAHSSFN